MHQLGAGVLGPVFRAAAPETGQPVAIKAFHLDLAPEIADELADALQQLVDVGLAHPGIVTPLAVGCEGSVPYLAQDYVAAESLDVAMRHYAPAAAERAVPLVYHLAGAVDAAHDAGVVHGSLHLRDVFVSPEEARATGFGVATALEHVGLRAPVRRPYAAPELVAARDWGPEADRYAVAAIAYELLTGRRATGSGDEIIERLGSVYVGDEGALPALKDVFAWGLAEEPADRPGHAAEFVTGLAEALGVEVVELEPLPASAPEDDPLASQPLDVPAPLAAAGAGSPPTAPFEAHGPDRESSAAGEERGEEPRGLAALGEVAAEAAPEAVPALPASLRAGGPEPAPTGAGETDDEDSVDEDSIDEDRGVVAPPAARADGDPEPFDDRLPFDDLEPIEDEEPLSLGGRVRATLQAAAAVVLGVLGAGVVYFLFGAEFGVGSGEPTVGADGDALEESLPLRPGGAGQPYPGPADPPPRLLNADPPIRPVETEPEIEIPAPADVWPPLLEGEASFGPDPVAAVPAAAEPEPDGGPLQVGWLLVRTFPPGATVSVAGVDRGRTPLSLSDVPHGVHQIEIQAPGYASETREVDISAAAAVAAVSVELTPGGAPPPPSEPAPARAESPRPGPAAADAGRGDVGSALIESRPAGARVVVDGDPAGITPLVLTELRSGRHEVRIEQDGYLPWITEVEVPAFDRIRVAASLERDRR